MGSPVRADADEIGARCQGELGTAERAAVAAQFGGFTLNKFIQTEFYKTRWPKQPTNPTGINAHTGPKPRAA